MKHWPALPFLVTALLPFAYMLATREAASDAFAPDGPAEILRIASPHSHEMKLEYRRAFTEWMRIHHNRVVDIRWLDTGGTSKMLKDLQSRFATNPDAPGVDLMFGGGVDPYLNAIEADWLAPADVPDEILAAIPPRCAGFPTYDTDRRWFGVALSGFGILYNRALLERLALPTPKSWDDLADPRLYSWVGSGDPSSSGSVHMCYEIILQAYGFEKGWHLITRLCGNVRRFGEGGGTVPREVATGDIAAGMVIDMYAQRIINAVGDEALEFVLPARMTLVGPDAIGMIRNASAQDLAQEFIRFALSEEGQRLLIRPEGVKGQQHALCRKPVRAALYDDPGAPRVNPYRFESGLQYDSAKGSARWQFVSDIIRAWCIDSHTSLRRAWKAVIDAGAPADLVNELCASPVNEEEASRLAEAWSNAGTREQIKSEWNKAARERYDRVFEKARNR